MVQVRTRRVVRSAGAGGAAAQDAGTSRYPELVNDARSKAKVARVSGDLRLVPFKARKRLGSEMSPKQRRMQIKFEREEAARRRVLLRAQLEELLSRSASASQLSLPRNVVGPVSPKALALMGDDLLTELSLRQVPQGGRVTPKVLKFFGPEPSLMPRKARTLVVGSEEETLPRPKRQRRSSLTALLGALLPASALPSTSSAAVSVYSRASFTSSVF